MLGNLPSSRGGVQQPAKFGKTRLCENLNSNLGSSLENNPAVLLNPGESILVDGSTGSNFESSVATGDFVPSAAHSLEAALAGRGESGKSVGKFAGGGSAGRAAPGQTIDGVERSKGRCSAFDDESFNNYILARSLPRGGSATPANMSVATSDFVPSEVKRLETILSARNARGVEAEDAVVGGGGITATSGGYYHEQQVFPGNVVGTASIATNKKNFLYAQGGAVAPKLGPGEQVDEALRGVRMYGLAETPSEMSAAEAAQRRAMREWVMRDPRREGESTSLERGGKSSAEKGEKNGESSSADSVATADFLPGNAGSLDAALQEARFGDGGFGDFLKGFSASGRSPRQRTGINNIGSPRGGGGLVGAVVRGGEKYAGATRVVPGETVDSQLAAFLAASQRLGDLGGGG